MKFDTNYKISLRENVQRQLVVYIHSCIYQSINVGGKRYQIPVFNVTLQTFSFKVTHPLTKRQLELEIFRLIFLRCNSQLKCSIIL